MKIFAALAFVATLAAPNIAAAQFGWGQQIDRSNFSYLYPTASGDWGACTNAGDRHSFDDIIAGCGRILERATDHDDRASVLWWRGRALEREGQADRAAVDFQDALAEYDAMILDDERSIDGHFYRGGLLVRLRRYDEARQEFILADRILPRQPETRASLANVAFVQGDYTTAIAEYDQAQNLARRSTTAGMYDHKRCEARAAAGVDLEVARQACNRAVRDSQGNPWTLVSRGYFRFRQSDFDGALADFERVLEHDHDNAAALYGRATLRARAGQQDTAAADLARARQLDLNAVDYYANAGMRLD